jgi:hypothetical protein
MYLCGENWILSKYSCKEQIYFKIAKKKSSLFKNNMFLNFLVSIYANHLVELYNMQYTKNKLHLAQIIHDFSFNKVQHDQYTQKSYLCVITYAAISDLVL